nr:hypothetical protein [Tanacetum cinerariifolium]
MANKKNDDCSTSETTSINNSHWQSDCKLARQRPDGIVLVIDLTIVGVQTTTYMSNNVPSVTGNHHIFHQPPLMLQTFMEDKFQLCRHCC